MGEIYFFRRILSSDAPPLFTLSEVDGWRISILKSIEFRYLNSGTRARTGGIKPGGLVAYSLGLGAYSQVDW